SNPSRGSVHGTQDERHGLLIDQRKRIGPGTFPVECSSVGESAEIDQAGVSQVWRPVFRVPDLGSGRGSRPPSTSDSAGTRVGEQPPAKLGSRTGREVGFENIPARSDLG